VEEAPVKQESSQDITETEESAPEAPSDHEDID